MIGAAQMIATLQTPRMHARVRVVLCVGFWVWTISWCLSRAITQIEKVEAKEKRRGRKTANLQRAGREGRGQWLEEIWASVAGHATRTSSKSDMARFTRK